MKKAFRTVALFLLLSLLLVPTTALAASQGGEARDLSVSIEMVYGGAKGIVSLTFDDGVYQTGLLVDELCEEYDLRASLMLIASRLQDDGKNASAEVWSKLFDGGRVEPQNHSMTHMNLRDSAPENLTEENYKSEILDSGDKLASAFPDYDFITYAVPYGSQVAGARAVAMSRYYMIRGVSRGKQTLDPGFTSGAKGSWSNLYSPSAGTSETDQLAYLKGWVDTAAEGFWYCPYIHKVGDVSGTEIPYDTLNAWFAYIKEIRDRGDIWVTTASSATKYIRERQNSTVTATLDGDEITVRVDMADKTQDGLSLDPEVFDHPLTVRIELPDGIEALKYTLNGECRKATAVKDSKSSYVLVDVIPSGEDLVLTSIDEDDSEHQLKRQQRVPSTCNKLGIEPHLLCIDCGAIFNLGGHPIDAVPATGYGEHSLVDVPRVEPTETSEGSIAHRICTECNQKFSFNGDVLFTDVSIPRLEPEKPDAPVGLIIGIALGALAAVIATVATAVIKVMKKGSGR